MVRRFCIGNGESYTGLKSGVCMIAVWADKYLGFSDPGGKMEYRDPFAFEACAW